MPTAWALGAVLAAQASIAALAPPSVAGEIELAAPLIPSAEAPRTDGAVDPVWERAAPARVTLSEGSQGSVEVTLRALRTDTHLHLLVQWPDRTESLGRFWEYAPGGWQAARGREDRLNIAWVIAGSIPDFALRGCQGLCHKSEGMMRTGGAGERLDLWYWMSQRTNPVGVADDWAMRDEVSQVEGQKTGRRPDAPEGGPYEANWDPEARRPRFAHRPGVKPGPVLLRRDAASVTAATRFKPGDRVPREVLAAPSGARAGIEARGRWERGRWTVELRRALVSGDDHDVQLTGPGPFHLAISIHDDADRDEHAQMGRDVLVLRLPAP